jgi:16S rRNA (cytosine967-C5)-methyltransferase
MARGRKQRGHGARRARRGARASGLEKGRFAAQGEPLVERLVLDVIARRRASGEPLDRAIDKAFRSARFGPRERRRAGDLAFAWARARTRVEALVDDALRAYGGVAPARRERDRAAVHLAALAHGLSAPVGPPFAAPLDALIDDAGELGVGALTGERAPFPPWLSERLRAANERGDALLEALAQPAPVVLAFDPRQITADEVIEALAQLDVEAEVSSNAPTAVRCRARVALPSLPARVRAAVWPMDDGSQAVVHALDVGEDDLVLDLCAGGGGKTRLLDALGARVVACDLDPRRLRAARERAPAPAVHCDAARPPFAAGSCSRILVDAPCSGTGTLRRAPDLGARLSPDDVPPYVALQRSILGAALELLAPGGRLVYATCSLLPDENEEVVTALLEGRDDLSAQLRTLTPDVHGTDGFFIATVEKASAG